MQLVSKIKKLGHEVGFDLINITRLSESEHKEKVEQWINMQRHGSMTWYEKSLDRRLDPREHLFGKAVTSISVGLYYRPTELPEEIMQDPSRGIIARYAIYQDYHKVMEKMLKELAGNIGQEINHDWQYRVYVDTGPVLEREVAERAQLGFTGKNTTLINTTLGSYFFLGEILCDLDIPVGDEHFRPLQRGEQVQDDNVLHPKHKKENKQGTCGTCTRCQDACPTNAFVEPYVLDARKCISYLTIENRKEIPLQYRPLLKNRIYGCDICQEVCPWNKKSEQVVTGLDLSLRKRVDQAPYLLDLIGLTEEQFRQQYKGTPILRAKRTGFIRNVLVAIGNWGDESAFVPVQVLLSDNEPLVRQHAVWALKQIDKHKAQSVLQSHMQEETDESVRDELLIS